MYNYSYIELDSYGLKLRIATNKPAAANVVVFVQTMHIAS